MSMPDPAATSMNTGTVARDGPQQREVLFARAILSPENPDVASATVGSRSTIVLIIRNTGQDGSFLNGQFPAATAPFTRVGSGIFSGIKAGGSATCEYAFSPSAAGTFDQKIDFLSNAGPASVTLSATSVQPSPSGGKGPKR